MSPRKEFVMPKMGLFPDWKDEIRFMLDQVDELVEAIHTKELDGVEAALQLKFALRSASTQAFSNAMLHSSVDTEDAEGEKMPDPIVTKHREFWEHALTQAEKALDAFNLIAPPGGVEQQRLFRHERTLCDDYTQFFRRVCADNSVHIAGNELNDSYEPGQGRS